MIALNLPSRLLLLALLVSCAPSLICAQTCLSGGITLSSQQQINDFSANFPGCSTILGALTISESTSGNITDLSPLAQVTQVNGRILVFDNTNLNSLAGLDNLTIAGSSVRISKSDGLTDLTGLSGLTSIASFFSIDRNDNLSQLSGINSALTVGGRLEIEDNPKLLSLDGLSGISRVGNTTLLIAENPMLTSLEGLGNIDVSSIANLVIADNQMLSVCEENFVCEYLSDPDRAASISGNNPGCRSRAEVEAACAALPVTYASFQGVEQNKTVDLSWSVSHQLNNERFEILVKRNEGSWNKLGVVAATSVSNYSFKDINPSIGDNLYRLNQIDFDGTETLSEIVNIKFASDYQINVFPNPVDLWLTINGEHISSNTNIRLLDLAGREVLRASGPSKLAVKDLMAGTYVLVCSTPGSKRVTKKIVVSH